MTTGPQDVREIACPRYKRRKVEDWECLRCRFVETCADAAVGGPQSVMARGGKRKRENGGVQDDIR